MIGRWCPRLRGFPPSHFHCAPGFATQTLAQMLDSLVRVSRRARDNHFVLVTTSQIPEGSQCETLRLGPTRDGRRGADTCRSTLPPLRPSAASRTDENLDARTEHHPVGWWKMRASHTGCIGFPFSDFRHSLTLFSKFFASFPHGTCSLSVSRQYLALEGIYLPIRAAVPSNSTL